MKVYEGLAKAFAAEGTKAVFGMMGDVNQNWINALHLIGVPMYEVRHEGPGLQMAEALAAVSGDVGVCTTTSGPGVTQLATTMVVAARSGSPLIAFCGDARWGDEEDQHRLDCQRFAAAIECGFVRVATPAGALEAVQKAFYMARHESRPVMLSAPLDVQLKSIDDDEEYQTSFTWMNNPPQTPNPAQLAKTVELVKKSDRIVIIAGNGAKKANAGPAFRELAQRTGALLATSLNAMNWPREADEFEVGISGLYATKTAIELFQEADCVIGVGASLNHYTTEHGYLYPNATFVQIDSKSQIVMGEGRPADIYIQADARLGTEALVEALKTEPEKSGYRVPETRKKLEAALDDPKVYDLEPNTVDPRDAARVVDEMVPDDFGFVISGSHALNIQVMLTRGRRPFTLINKYFGSMSKGIGQVIGACFGANKLPTVLVEGDVGFMMHIGEFDTAVRYELPILVIIMNDQAMGAELHKAYFKPDLDAELSRIPTSDLGAVGKAFGGNGHLVTTIPQLREAISEFVANPRPTIIDVRISTNVNSIPTRRLNGDDEV